MKNLSIKLTVFFGFLTLAVAALANTVVITAPTQPSYTTHWMPYFPAQTPPMAPGTIFDLRGQTWRVYHSQNPDPMGPCHYYGAGKLQTNWYPLGNPGDVTPNIGAVNGVMWGGRVLGDISLTVNGFVYASVDGYCNSAAIDMRRSGSTSQEIRGMRIDRIWDAVRFNIQPCFSTPGACNNKVVGTWISNARDDAVEADFFGGVTLRDSLLDGVFSGVSSTNGCTTCASHTDSDTILIDKSLIRMQGYPYKDQTNYHIAFVKLRAGYSPGVEIYDSVIAAEHWANTGTEATYSGWNTAFQMIRACGNNRFLWMIDTPIPAGLTQYMPSCFTVIQGAEARGYWRGARDRWLIAHPEVERAAGD